MHPFDPEHPDHAEAVRQAETKRAIYRLLKGLGFSRDLIARFFQTADSTGMSETTMLNIVQNLPSQRERKTLPNSEEYEIIDLAHMADTISETYELEPDINSDYERLLEIAGQPNPEEYEDEVPDLMVGALATIEQRRELLQAQIALLDDMETAAVRAAHRTAMTWEEIAAKLGRSFSSVYRDYRPGAKEKHNKSAREWKQRHKRIYVPDEDAS